MKPCDFLNIAITVCMIASGSTALRCYEGFNITIGGIPMYMWSEQNCDDGQNCMIQELAYRDEAAKFKDVVIRYGGCFPSRLEKFMSCSTSLFRHCKLEDIRELCAILDSKLSNLIATISNSPDQYLGKILSQGGSIEEFYAGILRFLNYLGYDEKKMEKPFYKFIDTIKSNSTDFYVHGLQLLNAMQVKNPSTMRLSHALLARVLFDLEDVGLEISNYHIHLLSALPGLSYPALKAMDIYDIDHIFNVLSDSLEKTDAVPSLTDSQSISGLLFQLQIGLTAMDNDEASKLLKIVDQISNNTFERFLAVYPDDAVITYVAVVTGELRKISQKTEDCRSSTISCHQQRLLSIQSLIKRSYADINDADKTDNRDDFMSVYQEYFLNREKFEGRWFRYMFEKVENYWKELSDLFNDPLFDFLDDEDRDFVTPCDELVCSATLCNSHQALRDHKEMKSLPGQRKRLEKSDL